MVRSQGPAHRIGTTQASVCRLYVPDTTQPLVHFRDASEMQIDSAETRKWNRQFDIQLLQGRLQTAMEVLQLLLKLGMCLEQQS